MKVGAEGSERKEYKNHYLQLYYCLKFCVKNDFGRPGELLHLFLFADVIFLFPDCSVLNKHYI